MSGLTVRTFNIFNSRRGCRRPVDEALDHIRRRTASGRASKTAYFQAKQGFGALHSPAFLLPEAGAERYSAAPFQPLDHHQILNR
jgi:hypothetical protein